MAAQRNKLSELHQTIAATRAAIFRIEVKPKGAEPGWVGSGFFISASGYALTAFHNVPRDVGRRREGHIQGWDSSGKPLVLKFIPMSGDEAHDIALLQACDGEPYLHLTLASLRSHLTDSERMHFWALRSVVIFGFPVQGGRQVENGIHGQIPGDLPLRSVVEENSGVPIQIERLCIVPKDSEELGGISGGPVVDLETGLVVAVAGARQRHQSLLLASAVRPWPADTRRRDLPFICGLPVRPAANRLWIAAGLVLVLASAGLLFATGFFDHPPSPNSPSLPATQTVTNPTSSAGDQRGASVTDPQRNVASSPAPEAQAAPPVSLEASACAVSLNKRPPYDEFGGSHTCGFDITGTVTPSSQARDVILFVTAGRDAPVTQSQGRFVVAAGERAWRIESCKGTRYSVVVVAPGALKELDAADSAVVPVSRQAGVSCVGIFEGQREP